MGQRRYDAHVEQWRRKSENGQMHDRWARKGPGVLSSFFNFFPWRPAIPSSLRPGGQRVRAVSEYRPPGHRSPCLAAEESLRAQVTPHTRRAFVLPREFHASRVSPQINRSRCCQIFLYSGAETHGGSQISQTGRIGRGTCVSTANRERGGATCICSCRWAP